MEYVMCIHCVVDSICWCLCICLTLLLWFNPIVVTFLLFLPVSISYRLPGAPLTYFNDGGVRRIFWGLTFWPKGIFWGLWKTPGFFWVAKTTEGFFWVLYFSSAQIKNNISAIYSFVFDQNQSWSWHVLVFQKLNNKICRCKNTEGFFWVC